MIFPICGINRVRSTSIFRICGIIRLCFASLFLIWGINRVRSALIFRICGINRLRFALLFSICGINRVCSASIFQICGINRICFALIFLRCRISRFVSLRYRKQRQDRSFVPPSFWYRCHFYCQLDFHLVFIIRNMLLGRIVCQTRALYLYFTTNIFTKTIIHIIQLHRPFIFLTILYWFPNQLLPWKAAAVNAS